MKSSGATGWHLTTHWSSLPMANIIRVPSILKWTSTPPFQKTVAVQIHFVQWVEADTFVLLPWRLPLRANSAVISLSSQMSTGMYPFLFLAFSAPRFNSFSTTSRYPISVAKCNAVFLQPVCVWTKLRGNTGDELSFLGTTVTQHASLC